MKAGFFENFPGHGVAQQLACFDEPARKRPVSFQWFVPALDQENRIAAKDECADAEQRVTRIAAGRSGQECSKILVSRQIGRKFEKNRNLGALALSWGRR